MGNCVQQIFLTINFLVFLGGITLSGLSVWLLLDDKSFLDLVNHFLDKEANFAESFIEIIMWIKSALYSSIALGKTCFFICIKRTVGSFGSRRLGDPIKNS